MIRFLPLIMLLSLTIVTAKTPTVDVCDNGLSATCDGEGSDFT